MLAVTEKDSNACGSKLLQGGSGNQNLSGFQHKSADIFQWNQNLLRLSNAELAVLYAQSGGIRDQNVPKFRSITS